MGQMTVIRAALAKVINDADMAVVAYDWVPDSVVVPCVIVDPAPNAIDYQQVYRSQNADWTFELAVVAGRVNERAGQETLDELVSPDGTRSIPALIDTDRTLGGVVAFAVPTVMRSYGKLTVAGVDYLGCVVEVEVNV